jgi:hypothetical protein
MEQQPKKFSRVTASIVTILGTLGLACQAQKPALTVDKANELVRESAEVHRFDQSILAKLGYANCSHSVRVLSQSSSPTHMYARIVSRCEVGPKPLDGLEVHFTYEDGAWKIGYFGSGPS